MRWTNTPQRRSKGKVSWRILRDGNRKGTTMKQAIMFSVLLLSLENLSRADVHVYPDHSGFQNAIYNDPVWFGFLVYEELYLHDGAAYASAETELVQDTICHAENSTSGNSCDQEHYVKWANLSPDFVGYIGASTTWFEELDAEIAVDADPAESMQVRWRVDGSWAAAAYCGRTCN